MQLNNVMIQNDVINIISYKVYFWRTSGQK